MSSAKQFAALFFGTALFMATGCVGPVGCGPGGNCGPLAFNSCNGCGDCDGCGELYIDPWVNEPADACDPCDKCGNFNGQSCGKCRSVFDGLSSLWGYRCDAGCCDEAPVCGTGGGCVAPILGGSCDAACGCEATCGCDSSCGGSCTACNGNGEDVMYLGNDTIEGDQYVESESIKAPYQPRRTRQIFNPDRTASGKAISVTR